MFFANSLLESLWCQYHNYILDKSDFSSVNNTNNTQTNDIKPIDINAIEGD